MSITAIIFDLDGVIVSTDECHFRAWNQLAEEEGIEFSREINERLRGISRMESLSIILEKADKPYSPQDRIELATRKNGYYARLIKELTPVDVLPGVMEILEGLKQVGIRIAIGSSSRNSPMILKQIGLDNFFDAQADGNDIRNSKPDPEVFLLAAERLGIEPQKCLVVEDADAGVQAAIAAGMRVLAVGSAAGHPDATMHAQSLGDVTITTLSGKAQGCFSLDFLSQV